MQWTIIVLVVLVLLAGLAVGYSLHQDPDSPEALANAERIRQETRDAARWRARWEPIGLALLGALGVVGVVALAAIVVAGYRSLDRRARTIYPDVSGVLPAVILRPGEIVADLGAMAGPLVIGPGGPSYALPPGSVASLQASANQGAAMTRTMRAWATRAPATRKDARPWPVLPEGKYPPVEILTGEDVDAHIYRLLEDGEGERGA